MGKVTSLSGYFTLPEIKLNFVINLNEAEPKEIEAKAVIRLLDKASGLTPEMQGIIAEFADYLARREGKPKGQNSPT